MWNTISLLPSAPSLWVAGNHQWKPSLTVCIICMELLKLVSVFYAPPNSHSFVQAYYSTIKENFKSPVEVYSTWGPALFPVEVEQGIHGPGGSCALPWRSRRALLSLVSSLYSLRTTQDEWSHCGSRHSGLCGHRHGANWPFSCNMGSSHSHVLCFAVHAGWSSIALWVVCSSAKVE